MKIFIVPVPPFVAFLLKLERLVKWRVAFAFEETIKWLFYGPDECLQRLNAQFKPVTRKRSSINDIQIFPNLIQFEERPSLFFVTQPLKSQFFHDPMESHLIQSLNKCITSNFLSNTITTNKQKTTKRKT